MFHCVEQYIRKCEVYQKNKFTSPYVKAPFQETDTQFQPWDKLYLDIVGLLPVTEEGYNYILTCQDNLSKYLLAIPMITQTADDVSLTLLCYGIPNSIVTDQGSHFMGNIFKKLCKLLNAHKVNTTAYHTESNGAL